MGTKNKCLDPVASAGVKRLWQAARNAISINGIAIAPVFWFTSKELANWAVDPDDWSFVTEDELDPSKDCDNSCDGNCDSKCEKQDTGCSNGESHKKPLNNDGRDTCFKCGAQTVVKRGFHMGEYNICPRCGF